MKRVDAKNVSKAPKQPSVLRNELSIGYAVTNAAPISESKRAMGYDQYGPPWSVNAKPAKMSNQTM
jgi:hypothetical protein